MPRVRRSRLPPLPLMAALFAGAIILSAARPASPPYVMGGCCAVKVASLHAGIWRVQVVNPDYEWLTAPAANFTSDIRICCSAGYCEPAAVPCSRRRSSLIQAIAEFAASSEDPSDALWLRSYRNGNEIAVLTRAGMLALLILIAAIIVEGGLLRPRRPGVGRFPFIFLGLSALSALLQLVVLPRKLQPDAFGSGPFQSILYLVFVFGGALLIPGITIVFHSIALVAVNFSILTTLTLFWSALGISKFLVGVIRFYFRNCWLQIRLLYGKDSLSLNVDYAQDIYIEQLNISYDFVTGISQNPLLKRVPKSINDTAKLVLRSTLGPGSARRFADMTSDDDDDDNEDVGQTTPTTGFGEDEEIPLRNYDSFLRNRELSPAIQGRSRSLPPNERNPLEITPLLPTRRNHGYDDDGVV